MKLPYFILFYKKYKTIYSKWKADALSEIDENVGEQTTSSEEKVMRGTY